MKLNKIEIYFNNNIYIYMTTFKNKRIKLELLRLPSKIDIIDINYVKKGIKTSDTSINYKVNKDYRNLIIYINNITIPETYPYNPLCLDYINIIICVIITYF